MFLAKPLRFRADLVCARSLRGSAVLRSGAFLCPANLARRASERTPASDLALRIPACELPSRTAPANPSERSRHSCHQRIGPLSAPISMNRTSRFFLALGATKRSRSTLPASDSDKISPWCVPRRRSVAVFTSCVFKGPRMGKAPLPGNLSQLRVFGLPAMARFRRCVFPDARRWQNAREMRFQAFDSGKISLRCVPEGASDEKNASSWQDIAAMHSK